MKWLLDRKELQTQMKFFIKKKKVLLVVLPWYISSLIVLTHV